MGQLIFNRGFKIDGVVDQSDLSMFADIEVSIPYRAIDSFKVDNSMHVESINEGYIGNMTTSYTDITFNNYSENGRINKELFGISSIEISFNTSFHPVVDVTFIDTKGCNLFNAQETMKQNTFFASLFHFPYPKFRLKIKGYYGTPVVYGLRIINFDASFDSNSGDYIVKVTFVGDMYGILSDLPFSLLLVAPYCGDNNELTIRDDWKNFKADYENEHFTVPTMLQILEKYTTFINISDEVKNKYGQNIGQINADKVAFYADIDYENLRATLSGFKKRFKDVIDSISKEDNTISIKNGTKIYKDLRIWTSPSGKKMYFLKTPEQIKSGVLYDLFKDAAILYNNTQLITDVVAKGEVEETLAQFIERDLDGLCQYAGSFKARETSVEELIFYPLIESIGSDNADDFITNNAKWVGMNPYELDYGKVVSTWFTDEFLYFKDSWYVSKTVQVICNVNDKEHREAIRAIFKDVVDIIIRYHKTDQTKIEKFTNRSFGGKFSTNRILFFNKTEGKVGQNDIVTYADAKTQHTDVGRVDVDASWPYKRIKGLCEELYEHRKEFFDEASKEYFYIFPCELNFNREIELETEFRKNREVQKASSLELMKIYKEHLGFSPTISNIIKVLFCHAGFLCKRLTDLYKDIFADNRNNARNSTLTGNVMTDYKTKKIPPFPLVAQQKYDAKTNEYKYEKILPSQCEGVNKNSPIVNLRECAFVDEIYTASIAYSKKLTMLTEGVETIEFKHILTTDIKEDYNPYFINDTSTENITKHICKVLAFRIHNNINAGNYTSISRFIAADWENIKNVLLYYQDSTLIGSVGEKGASFSKAYCVSTQRTMESKNILNYKVTIDEINKGDVKAKDATGDNCEWFAILPLDDDVRNILSEEKYATNVSSTTFPKNYIPFNIRTNFLSSKNKAGTLNMISGDNIGGYGNNNEILKGDDKYEKLGAYILAYTNCEVYDERFMGLNDDELEFKNVVYDGIIKTVHKCKLYWILKFGAAYKNENLFNNNYYCTSGINKNFMETCGDIFVEWCNGGKGTTIYDGIIANGLQYYYDINDEGAIKLKSEVVANESDGGVNNPFTKDVVLCITEKYEKKMMDVVSDESSFSVLNTKCSEIDVHTYTAFSEAVNADIQFSIEGKTGIYYTLKDICDKYMYDIKDNIFRYNKNNNEFFNFYFSARNSLMQSIDSNSYIDTGLLYARLNNLKDMVPSKTLLQIMADIAEDNKYLFVTFPMKIDIGDEIVWDKVFAPVHKYGLTPTQKTSILFIQCNEESFVCKGEDFVDDTFDEYINISSTAFDVEYGKQQNGIFKEINMNMGGSIETEESIANTLSLSQYVKKDGMIEDRIKFSNMNLFDIYKERSYKVSINMMGNANITPFMFFNLKNIPMYGGMYRIIDVKHNIIPNNFNTTLTGIKVSKFSKPESAELGATLSLLQLMSNKIQKLSTKVNKGGYTNIVTPQSEETHSISALLQGMYNKFGERESAPNDITCADTDKMIDYIKQNADVPTDVKFSVNIEGTEHTCEQNTLYALCKIIKHWNRFNTDKIWISQIVSDKTNNSPHTFGLAADLSIFDKISGVYKPEKTLELFALIVRYVGATYVEDNHCESDLSQVLWESKNNWKYDNYPQWVHISVTSGTKNELFGKMVTDKIKGAPKNSILCGKQGETKFTTILGDNRPSNFIEILRCSGRT